MDGPLRGHYALMEELDLPVSPASPGRARRLVDAVAAPLPPQAHDAAVLAVSELVTNAVRHARAEVSLRVWCTDSSLRVEVSDDGPGLPLAHDAEETAVHGRGLRIVEALSDRWGVTEHADVGKTTWLEIDRAPPGRGPVQRGD